MGLLTVTSIDRVPKIPVPVAVTAVAVPWPTWNTVDCVVKLSMMMAASALDVPKARRPQAIPNPTFNVIRETNEFIMDLFPEEPRIWSSLI